MKTIGFIKPYDTEKFSLELDTYMDYENVNENQEKLVYYLKKGVLCVPLMGAIDNPFNDDDDDFIIVEEDDK